MIRWWCCCCDIGYGFHSCQRNEGIDIGIAVAVVVPWLLAAVAQVQLVLGDGVLVPSPLFYWCRACWNATLDGLEMRWSARVHVEGAPGVLVVDLLVTELLTGGWRGYVHGHSVVLGAALWSSLPLVAARNAKPDWAPKQNANFAALPLQRNHSGRASRTCMTM